MLAIPKGEADGWPEHPALVVANTPEQFDQFLASEQARWMNVIEVGRITAD